MHPLNGQVPTGASSVPNAGAQSQADDASTPQVPPTGAIAQSQADGDTTGHPQPTLTLEQALREVERTRREAAETRTQLRALEAYKAEAERAQLSEAERLAADLADSERKRNDLVIRHQERAIQYETRLQAASLNIVDPDAAVKLLDASRIEYDPDGTPQNIGELLKELVAAKPYLIATSPAGRPIAANVNPTNPASEAGRTATFTQAQIAAMSSADYQKHKAAIFQAQREGRIRDS